MSEIDHLEQLADDHWVIGLSADLSSGAAEAGEAIRRGAHLAVQEINAEGGILGKPLAMVKLDHRGNPTRATDTLEALASSPQRPALVALLGGLHSPVALAEIPLVHDHQLPFLVPWAAATHIITNRREPNYAFRVSVRDQFAAAVICTHGMKRGLTKPGLLLEQTGWGRSNLTAFTAALDGNKPPHRWFGWGTTNFRQPIDELIASGVDHFVMVCNPNEGREIIQAIAELPVNQQLPILSHWGITGAGRRFFDAIAPALEQGIDLSFLQSYNFFEPPLQEPAERLLGRYHSEFCTDDHQASPSCVFAAPGTAQAYELVHLLATAIRRAGSTDGPAVRDSLEQLGDYDGLIKNYRPVFTSTRHDALSAADLLMCHYNLAGDIVPSTTKQSP